MQIKIDFLNIKSMEDFYAQLQKELDLPEHFGKNMDALSDVISGEVKLPLKIHFINMELSQLEEFQELIQTMKSLEEEVEEFTFRYAIKGV
ncbi:MAG TPA: barstar family protein [Flavobacteriaceae bacterium]|nr:barstar family protein [Flavobacteriaceae bacterium]